MNRTKSILLMIGLVLTPISAMAQAPGDQPADSQQMQSPIPLDQQPTREQLTKLFELMRIHDQLQSFMKMMPTMMEQQVQAQAQELASTTPGGHVLTPDQQEAIDRITKKYMQKALNIYPPEEMLDDMTAIYKRHLTRTDVDAFIAFYSSTAGQHLLNEQPAIMKEYMPIAMKRAQDRTRAMTEDLTKELQEIVNANPAKAAGK